MRRMTKTRQNYFAPHTDTRPKLFHACCDHLMNGNAFPSSAHLVTVNPTASNPRYNGRHYLFLVDIITQGRSNASQGDNKLS